jgi:hypothetical protein
VRCSLSQYIKCGALIVCRVAGAERSLRPLVFAFSDSRLDLAGLVRIHDEILNACGGVRDPAGCIIWPFPPLVCIIRCSVMR